VDFQPEEPRTWLVSALALLLSLVTWGTRRQVKQWDDSQAAQDRRHEALDTRLRSLENQVATKGDITALYERVNSIGEESAARHAEILRLLIRDPR
jgi:hypothetical protein